MRVIIYCRVSTVKQSNPESQSLEYQRKSCLGYVKMKRWPQPEILVDVASGKNDKRAGYQKLLAAIASRSVDLVMVYRLDRLSRNVKDIYELLETIRTSGTAFVSVAEHFDTTTAMGRAMLGVAAVFAQLTREIIGEYTKETATGRAANGYYNGNTKHLFGYDYRKADQMMIINRNEAPLVHEVYNAFTERGLTLLEIPPLLNQGTIKTRTGVPWTTTSVAHILTNPVYAGRVRCAGTLAKGRHKAMITTDQYDTAQVLHAEHTRLWHERQTRQYLFSNLAACGRCGKILTGKTCHGSTVFNCVDDRADYTYGHHPIKDVSASVGGCPGIHKSGYRLEYAVLREIARLGGSDGTADDATMRLLMSGTAPRAASVSNVSPDTKAASPPVFLPPRVYTTAAVAENSPSGSRHDAAERETFETLARGFLADWTISTWEKRQTLLRRLIESLRVFPDSAEVKLFHHAPVLVPLDFSWTLSQESSR